jgi:hypothetical protein
MDCFRVRALFLSHGLQCTLPRFPCRHAGAVMWPPALSRHYAFRLAYQVGHAAVWVAIPLCLSARGQRWVTGSFSCYALAAIASACLGAETVASIRAGGPVSVGFAEALAHTIEWTPLTPIFVAVKSFNILAACAMTFAALLPLTQLPESTQRTRRLTRYSAYLRHICVLPFGAFRLPPRAAVSQWLG